MKRLSLLSFLLITSCTSTVVPVTKPFPDAPTTLMTPCPNLEQVKPTKLLSDVLPSIVDNYSTYYDCQAKDDGWIQWYTQQKEIFSSTTNK